MKIGCQYLEPLAAGSNLFRPIHPFFRCSRFFFYERDIFLITLEKLKQTDCKRRDKIVYGILIPRK